MKKKLYLCIEFKNNFKKIQLTMLTATDVRDITCESQVSSRSLEQLIMAAQINHLNYVFIDKALVSPELQNELRSNGYIVVVGYGDAARIKISWQYV